MLRQRDLCKGNDMNAQKVRDYSPSDIESNSEQKSESRKKEENDVKQKEKEEQTQSATKVDIK